MNIGLIDADLIGRGRHRFPNLASMKLSSYHKRLGDSTELLTDYDRIKDFDRVYISKVFTDTPVPDHALQAPNVSYGGTGFFYDKAPPLPNEIEHIMPDYHLYDSWVEEQLANGGRRSDFKYYLDYSIGFLTRGCFRQCDFCVNKNYTHVFEHSPLSEFLDPERKKICLLDDNFLGCPHWKDMLDELKRTGRKFQFKQGLDERILTPEKCEALFSSNYDGDFIFAFDNVEDYALIESKLQLIRKYTNRILKFYVFCGFDRNDRWDDDFWKQDLWNVFRRIELLMKYQCLPYIMRFQRYEESPYRGIYVNLARWCNQPSMFKKKSYREFTMCHQRYYKSECAAVRYLKEIERDMPDLAEQYFDMRYDDFSRR